MKKILITGASGFIGKHIVEKAIQLGYDTYAGIRKSSNKTYLKTMNTNILLLDFGNTEQLIQTLQKHSFDIIIHAAGATFGLSENDYINGNYKCLKNLTDSIESCQNQPNKFIFLSSLAAFGPNEMHNGQIVDNNSIPHPITAYGRSKLKAENYLKSSQLPYVIIRPTAVYGPGDKAFLSIYKAIKFGIEVYTTTKPQIMTFIYVDDLVATIFSAIDTPNRSEYFVTDGNQYYLSEFYQLIKNFFGVKTIRIKFSESVTKLAAYINEFIFKIIGKAPSFNCDKVPELNAKSWICDDSKTINELHKPKYNLRQGLEIVLQDLNNKIKIPV